MRDQIDALMLLVSFSVVAFILYFALLVVSTKSRMCDEIGSRLYGREMTWIECFAL